MAFNALEELFSQAYFHSQFIKKYPHCADCEHVNQLIFSRRVYYNYMKDNICSKCDKYEASEANE